MIKKILKEIKLYLLILILLIVIFYLINNSFLMEYIQGFDNYVIKLISSIKLDLKSIMIIFTILGEWFVPTTIILILFFINNKKVSYYLCNLYGFSGIIAFIMKELIARPRPTLALIKIPSSYSFPSGHTLCSICFYVSFGYLLTYKCSKITRIITIFIFSVISLIIGFSRIYLGVHYFSDVIGGLIMSIPCLLISFSIINKHYKEVFK